jgi:signal transduction histidine kinase
LPKGGVIAVRIENRTVLADVVGLDAGSQTYATVLVTDDGIGMTPAVLERAFEPFFTTKEVGSGVGLGLSMVHGFARQSMGFVELTSEPGEGATACLALPLVSVPIGHRPDLAEGSGQLARPL